MADQVNYPTVIQKVTSQFHLRSQFSQDLQARNYNFCSASWYEKRLTSGNYVSWGFQKQLMQFSTGTWDVPVVATVSPVFAQAPAEKGFAGFAIDFLVGGVSAAVSKTAAAPIEHVKLVKQNQDEMIKTGCLSEPYTGITDCFARTIKDEGTLSLLERKHR